MRDDWYRNTTWDGEIEATFEARLRRSRTKGQYLRIQASILGSTRPEVALRLLDRYFELEPEFDEAQAHVDRAEALLTLGRVRDALVAYEAALAREAVFPNYRSQAFVLLPYIIATYPVEDQYDRALEVLQLHHARLTFPLEHFRWYAASALIASGTGDSARTASHAKLALVAAQASHSGFRYHKSVGLVTSEFASVVRRLEGLCGE